MYISLALLTLGSGLLLWGLKPTKSADHLKMTPERKRLLNEAYMRDRVRRERGEELA